MIHKLIKDSIKKDIFPIKRAYYEWILEHGNNKTVKCTSFYELFDKEEQKYIKDYFRYEGTNQYKIAGLLCRQTLTFPRSITLDFPKIDYIEGCFHSGTEIIDHAWNKKGDYYFDYYHEVMLKQKVTDTEYFDIIQYSPADIITFVDSCNNIYLSDDKYRNIHQHLLSQKIKI